MVEFLYPERVEMPPSSANNISVNDTRIIGIALNQTADSPWDKLLGVSSETFDLQEE